jgi:hypothetical protein
LWEAFAGITSGFSMNTMHCGITTNHILRALDRLKWEGKRVLEIGIGQGADAEQLIQRGRAGLDWI